MSGIGGYGGPNLALPTTFKPPTPTPTIPVGEVAPVGTSNFSGLPTQSQQMINVNHQRQPGGKEDPNIDRNLYYWVDNPSEMPFGGHWQKKVVAGVLDRKEKDLTMALRNARVNAMNRGF